MMKLSRLAVLFPLLLCACSTPPVSPPALDYSQLDKINLDIRDITFVDRGVDEVLPAPVVTDQFTPTIAESVHNWVSGRVQAVGVSGTGAFIVKNAYVMEQGIPDESSLFEGGKTHKYTGHIEVEFETRGSEGTALATANASRAVTLPDNPDEDEKRDAYRALLNGLMQDLNTYLDQAIRTHMKDFVVTAPIIGSKLPEVPVPQSPGISP